MADFDVDEAIDGYVQRIDEARICLRQDLLAEHRRLDLELTRANQVDDASVPELAERLAQIEAEMSDAERVFVFQAVSKEEWADLLREHPPTPEQLEADKGLDHNPETFPMAAIAASSVSPKLTVAQVKRIHATYRLADFQKLWGTVLNANLEVAAAPKSMLAGVVLRTNASSSTTAPRKASRGRSSSAGSGARTRRATTTTPAG